MKNNIIIEGDIAKIELLYNKFAIIDTEDISKIQDYRWYYDGSYVKTTVRDGINPKYNILLHKIIIENNSKNVIDHINGNPLDNRKSNLRICSISENSQNRHNVPHSNTKIRGVYERNGKFRICIMIRNTRIEKGGFKTKQEAIDYIENIRNNCNPTGL